MKRLTGYGIIELLNLIKNSNDHFDKVNGKNFEEIMRDKIKHIFDQWYNSNCTDYNIYNNSDYIYEGLLCYKIWSSIVDGNTINYLIKNGYDLSDLTIFDDYNGLGFTSLDFVNAGFKEVYYHNTCVDQVNIMNKIADHYNIKKPILDINKSGVYDVVFSCECCEHHYNIDTYLDSIVNMVKPGGHLIISVGTQASIGHFPEYETSNGIVKARNLRSYIKIKLDKEGFGKALIRFFNGTGHVFEKQK